MATLNSLESLPTNLKDIQKYLDIAKEYEAVDLTVTYWCEYYALLKGYTLYKGYEDLRFLHHLDERLSKHKQEFNPLKAIIDHVSARDHVQSVAFQHFNWADMGFKFFATKHSVSLIIETLQSTETLLDVCSSFWGTNEELAEKKNLANLNGAVLKTRLSKVTAEINQQNSVDSSGVIGEVTISSPSESLSPTNTLKDIDRVDTVNPEGVKRYDRQFLLELRYYPASLKKPQQLPETLCVHCPDDHRNKNEEIILAYPISFEDILKGLTWANIQQRKEQVKALTIDTEERLIDMSQLICKKVLVAKAVYLPLLAKMCSALSHRKVASALNPAKTTNFRALLLDHCQRDFDRERHSPVDVVEKEKEIENAETTNKQVWNKSTRITRFIGELFKYRVASSNFLNSFMCRLLTRAEIEDEESLDCLCILLSTVGKAVEYRVEMKEFLAISNLENLNIAFNFLESVVTKSEISDCIRSRIEHVIDLRNRDWIFKKQNLKCLDSLRRETSNGEFQPTTESNSGATQDSQFKCYPIQEQNICDSPRQQHNVDESLEDGDNVAKDELTTLAAPESAFFSLQEDHLEQDLLPREVTISLSSESLSPTNTLKDNRARTVNPEGVKRYDRHFILELRYCHASLIKPRQLPDMFCVKYQNERAYPVSFKRNILNGLTWSNFQQRLEKVKTFTFDTEERLMELSKQIYKKVVKADPVFSPLLAKICSALSNTKVTSALNPARTITFRTLLMDHCRIEFDREKHPLIDVAGIKEEIQNAETKTKKKVLSKELGKYLISNRRSTRTTRFFGELFKLRFASSNFLNSCICRLLTQVEVEEEDSLECLCILLSTVGKEVEHRVEMKELPAISNLENLNIAFNVLESAVTKSEIPDNVRSQIEHVIDLCNRNRIFKKHNLERFGSLRREMSDAEFQPTTESNPGATQDSQFKCYPIQAQNICDSPRQCQILDESLEDVDYVEKDELVTLAASESAFFPLQDDHLEQDSHPSQISDIPVCSSSQQSHENSAADPVLGSLESPQLTRDMSQDIPLGKFTLTNDEIALKSLLLLCTFFTNDKNIEDAVLGVKEWLHPSTVARFINQCLLLVNELGREERRATSTLFKEMVKRNLFNTSDLKEGFTELLQGAEDWMVIFPKLLWESAVELVEPLFEEGVINLKFLPQLSSVLISPLAADFVAAVLKELVLVQGVAEAERLFVFSNASLTSVLPLDVDLIAFRNHHKELEFLSKFDSLPKDSDFARMPSNPVPTCQVNIDFQCSLVKFLRDANQLTDNEVYMWIQKHNFEVNCDFIRTLTNAFYKCSMEEHDSEINYITFERWTNLLRQYVCNCTDYELEVLFTIQKCSNEQQNFNCIILILLHSGVVSFSSWELWRSMNMLFAPTCE